MSDIVERLKANIVAPTLLSDAADTIESLRQQLSQREEELKKEELLCNDIFKSREALREELDRLRRELSAVKQKLEATEREWDEMYDGGNCSCHINPPCDSCTHEGNPIGLEETDEAWEPDNE